MKLQDNLTGRQTIAFDYKWKPTRQLRAGVVYDEFALAESRAGLNANPAKLNPQAVPYGNFSLSNGWNPEAADKILVRPFAPQPVPLAIGKNRYGKYLTANRYEVAASIAARFAASGLKVIVFCESIVAYGSVANNVNEIIPAFESQRDEQQNKQREIAIAELGVESAIYDAGTTTAAVHHGELLQEERRLVESLFRQARR